MSDTPSRILVVEDDDNLRLALCDNLEAEGYEVIEAAHGEAAQVALREHELDLVVLDIMLPDIDGYTICRRLRAAGKTCMVLMLTARTLDGDLDEGFEAGADDYLAKPYRLKELLLRVQALLRRRAAAAAAAAVPDETVLRFAGYTLDLDARRTLDPEGREITLTRTELELLAYLVRNPDRALSRNAMLDEVWGKEVVVDGRTVDNFISNLKKKLGWSEGSKFRIRTVRGVGYRMEIDA